MVFESSLEQVDLNAIMFIAKFCTGWSEVSLQILATMHSLRTSGPDLEKFMKSLTREEVWDIVVILGVEEEYKESQIRKPIWQKYGF